MGEGGGKGVDKGKSWGFIKKRSATRGYECLYSALSFYFPFTSV